MKSLLKFLIVVVCVYGAGLQLQSYYNLYRDSLGLSWEYVDEHHWFMGLLRTNDVQISSKPIAQGVYALRELQADNLVVVLVKPEGDGTFSKVVFKYIPLINGCKPNIRLTKYVRCSTSGKYAVVIADWNNEPYLMYSNVDYPFNSTVWLSNFNDGLKEVYSRMYSAGVIGKSIDVPVLDTATILQR
ncbi:hypothetical protein 12VC501_gene0051 [Vibrio phage 12VC501]|nr:hypothetical protein 12VC501_gene0051 [Vibrio phage 12VC501]